jgi:hypothetical protein
MDIMTCFNHVCNLTNYVNHLQVNLMLISLTEFPSASMFITRIK